MYWCWKACWTWWTPEKVDWIPIWGGSRILQRPTSPRTPDFFTNFFIYFITPAFHWSNSRHRAPCVVTFHTICCVNDAKASVMATRLWALVWQWRSATLPWLLAGVVKCRLQQWQHHEQSTGPDSTRTVICSAWREIPKTLLNRRPHVTCRLFAPKHSLPNAPQLPHRVVKSREVIPIHQMQT